MKTFQKLADDPWFDSLDFFQQIYMYEQWMEDKNESHELNENYAVLTGSFSNPDAGKAYWKQKNPKFKSSDEDFAKSMEMVENQEVKPMRRRQRKLLNKVNANG